MFIEFRVRNFLSFREEQALSLVASSDTSLADNWFHQAGQRLLRTAAIYGPNASGKSNLVKAVSFMQSLVRSSAEVQPGQRSGRVPYRLDAKSAQEPSLLEATFTVKGVRYQYGFTVTEGRIQDEWLLAYPRKQAQRWFDRSFDKQTGEASFVWGPSFRGEKVRLAKLTRPDALFLSVGAKFNHKQLTPIYEWFDRRLRTLGPGDRLKPVTAILLGSPGLDASLRSELKSSVMAFLRDADLGITGFDTRKREIGEEVVPKEIPADIRGELLKRIEEEYGYEIEMFHRNQDTGEDVPFDLRNESDGTQRFFELAGPWLEAVTLGYTVFLDELDASLHPLLARELVKFFQNPKVSPQGAQLVFTTHDTTLLDPEVLRRDQVWFTEKDKTGASHLYSLYEYKKRKVRKGEALQKGYLAGRYGAIPILRTFGLK